MKEGKTAAEREREREIDREYMGMKIKLQRTIYIADIPPYVRPRMYKQIEESSLVLSHHGMIIFPDTQFGIKSSICLSEVTKFDHTMELTLSTILTQAKLNKNCAYKFKQNSQQLIM